MCCARSFTPRVLITLLLLLSIASSGRGDGIVFTIRNDDSGRVLRFPFPSVPYTSFFSHSGRPCGNLNVESQDKIPAEGRRIVLEAGLGLAYYNVVQATTVRSALSGGKPLYYAYVCAVDGKAHAVVEPGEWVYDIMIDAPKFLSIDGQGGCSDRGDWTSLTAGLTCEHYDVGGGTYGDAACQDMGAIDISIGGQVSFIQRDIPAYEACPRACRNCYTCTPPANPPPNSSAFNLWGCESGKICQVTGGVQMVEGVVISGGGSFPPLADPNLLSALMQWKYNCSRGGSVADVQQVGGVKINLPEGGATFIGNFGVRIVGETIGASLVAYTLDGSLPSLTNGRRVPSGTTVSIHTSGTLRAISIMPESYSGQARTSTISTLPPILIQLSPPKVQSTLVGSFAPPNTNCSNVSSFAEERTSDQGERLLSSNGCPTAVQDQDARVQLWLLGMPTNPIVSRVPTSIVGDGGIVGFATDGVPITAPPLELDGGEYATEVDLRDACGGVSVTVKDAGATLDRHGVYHYRTASPCVGISIHKDASVHSRLVGFMIDGIPLFDYMPGLTDLDECNGHMDDTNPFYHYHAAGNDYPYTIACLRGCLRPDLVGGTNVKLVQKGLCVPAAMQYDYRTLQRLDWLRVDQRSRKALDIAGRYTGVFRVDAVCAGTLSGVPDVVFRSAVGGGQFQEGVPVGVGYVGVGGFGGGGGAAFVIVRNTSLGGVEVKAMCEIRQGMMPSVEVSGGVKFVDEVAASNLWATTLGYWDLNDYPSFYGTISKPLSTVEGGCSERHPTLSSPITVPDLTRTLGDLTLTPPTCKAGVLLWDNETQPSLTQPLFPLGGVEFSRVKTPQGLRLARDVGSLVAAHVLPHDSFSVETVASFPEHVNNGDTGGLFSAMYRAPAFFGRGVSLSWLAVGSDVFVRFSLSTAGSEEAQGENRGGTVDVYAAVDEGGEYVHIAGCFDGTQALLYVNGSLVNSTRACPSPPQGSPTSCGGITWGGQEPQDSVPLSVGYAEGVPHTGGIAFVRVLSGVLTQRQITASAKRVIVSRYGQDVFSNEEQVRKCEQGSEGPYDGNPPCTVCDAGKLSPVRGMVECTLCPHGKYSPGPDYALDGRGASACFECAGGVLTPNEGAVSADQCTGPDFCSFVGNLSVCDEHADCITRPGGKYLCECWEGWQGGGAKDGGSALDPRGCTEICADGLVVGREECDDGNTLEDDGCSSSCKVESGFSCNNSVGASQCVCTLDHIECCQKTYALCVARVFRGLNVSGGLVGNCVEDCFVAYAECLRGQEGAITQVTNDILMSEAYKQAVRRLDTNGVVTGIAASGCNPTAAKACQRSYALCVDQEQAYDVMGVSIPEWEQVCGQESCTGAYSVCLQKLQCASVPVS